jgi:peptide deformylase
MTETVHENAPGLPLGHAEAAAHTSAPTEASADAAATEGGLAVVLYPDPTLRRETRAVEAFDSALRATVDAMLARMFASRGVGLAAPQVGLSQRLFVFNPEGDPERPELSRAVVNPMITARGGRRVRAEEGCLSLPQIYAEIERPERCTMRYQDVTGATHVEDFEGFEARIVQHEFDHLEGVLIVDRMTPADKARHRAALDELRADFRAERG